MSKRCSRCNIDKSPSSFHKNKNNVDGRQPHCKDCDKIHRQSKEFKTKANKRAAKYRNKSEVKERNSLYHKQYRKTKKGKDSYRAAIRKHRKKKYHEDIEYRLIHIQRQRISDIIRSNSRSQTTLDLIGCSASYLKYHLESQFNEFMNWSNYGTYWEVDHKFPLSKAIEISVDKFNECCNYKNLQPLKIEDNRVKSNKIVA